MQQGDTTSDIDEDACPRPRGADSIRIHHEGLPTFAPAFAQLAQETSWASEVADKLGLAPEQPEAANFEELSEEARFDYLHKAIRRAQRGPRVPHQATLETLFGRVTDTFSTFRLNQIIDEVLRHKSHHAHSALHELADGIDVARFFIGEAHSGWCVYRLKASATPGTGADIIRADLNYKLRYCLAGTELHAFDKAGEVEKSWDATGFPRRAPLFNPTDTSRFIGEDKKLHEELGDRYARDKLLEHFLDGLVAGELNDVSQLETLSLARGAELIEPATDAAMRRMLAQSSNIDQAKNQAP